MIDIVFPLKSPCGDSSKRPKIGFRRGGIKRADA